MGRTACTEPQYLYKVTLYIFHIFLFRQSESFFQKITGDISVGFIFIFCPSEMLNPSKFIFPTRKNTVLELFTSMLPMPSEQFFWNREEMNSNVGYGTIMNYSRIKSARSPSFCIPAFSASLTHITALLHGSRDYSLYVSGPILAPPPLWLQKHTGLARKRFRKFSRLVTLALAHWCYLSLKPETLWNYLCCRIYLFF
jgi:hypothetical protein